MKKIYSFFCGLSVATLLAILIVSLIIRLYTFGCIFQKVDYLITKGLAIVDAISFIAFALSVLALAKKPKGIWNFDKIINGI